MVQGRPAEAVPPLPDYNGAYLVQHCHNLMMDSEVYMLEKPRFCLGDAPLKDWRTAVIDWLKKRPNEIHTSSRKVIVQALNENFPCEQ